MKSTEQGSVIGFVLGGILLLALLVGGIILYKNNISKMIGVSPDNSQVAANNSTNTQADQTASDQAAQNDAALKQQQEAEKKAQEQNQAANNGTGATNSAPTATTTPRTSTAPALPTTGPGEDALMAAVGFSLVIGASVAYNRSRAAL